MSEVSATDITPRPIILAPICSHQTEDLILESIPYISQTFKKFNPNGILLNIATDGDPARRKALNKLRKPNNSLPVLKLLTNFDINLVCGEYSVNFDPKYLIKRIRSIIISSNRSILISKRAITSSHVKDLLVSNNVKDNINFLNPSDKQNVPMAVTLMKVIEQLTNFW